MSSGFLLAAAKVGLLAAGQAAAALLLDEVIEIIAAVIVGDLLARRDGARGLEDDLPAPADEGLRVRPAGVVHVARHVVARRAVDHPTAVELEHVAGAALLELLRGVRRDAPAAIARDVRGLLDQLGRKQAESGLGTADAEFARRHRVRLAVGSVDVIPGARSRLSSLQEIGDDDLRRIVSRRTRHSASRMSTRAAQIKSGDRHAIVGVPQHGAKRK